MTKTEQILTAYGTLPIHANNRQIAQRCIDDYGYKPSPAMLYACLGSESSRKLKRYTGEQTLEVKATCKKYFNGDYDLFSDVVHDVKTYVQP